VSGSKKASPASATLASLALVAAAPVHASELPELLHKVGLSVARGEAQMKHLDFTERSVDEQRSADGKVLHRMERERRVLQAKGPRRQEILRAVQDGKDLTERARQAASGKTPEEQGNPSPLSPGEQDKYRFETRPADPAHPEWLHLAFAPKGAPSPKLLVGEAWIDPHPAALRRLAFHPSEQNPAEKMEVDVSYDQLLPDTSLPSRMEATIQVERGGFQQVLHSEVTFHFEAAPEGG
jgi:hypothetical protein